MNPVGTSTTEEAAGPATMEERVVSSPELAGDVRWIFLLPRYISEIAREQCSQSATMNGRDDSLTSTTGPVTDYGSTLAHWMRNRAAGVTTFPLGEGERPTASHIADVSLFIVFPSPRLTPFAVHTPDCQDS